MEWLTPRQPWAAVDRWHQPPTANANGPYSGETGTGVSFSSADSSDPDGSITGYDWDFGDGGTSTQANPSHTYGSAANYTVTLIVTDNQGATGSDVTSANITDPPTNNPPVADFSGSPTSGNAPLNVNFTDNSTNSPTSWNWTFGDGGTSTAQNPSHTYANAGTYTVSLTATNAYGSDTMTKTNYITVNTDPPSGEGYILSKNPDFSTDDRSFTTSETMYMKVWTDRVDYTNMRKEQWELKVEAVSDNPNATLTVVGWGTMSYNSKKGIWKFRQKNVSSAPATVTVTSDFGGSNTSPVTIK